LLIAAISAAACGFYHRHNTGAIIADLIPYFFFLYIFPLSDLYLSDKFRDLGKQAIIAAIFGNAILTLLTQAGLSAGIFALQDHYYHWYRDVALGKITDLDFHFYRLVLNEHLLLIPLTIYFIGDIIKNQANKINVLALSSLLFILANNLTRIYMVALAAGTLILFSIKNWKRWLAISASAAIGFMLIFVTTHTIASRGQSFGLEIFGLRLQSIASPQMEDSSLSRLLLLPKILEKIKSAPILGQGLGDTVTVYSPVFKTNITTPHFDWGYLEIWAEMGLYGLAAWVAFAGYLLYHIIKNKHKYNKNIFAAILIGFMIINITSPALFHVFGILLFITILTPIGLKFQNCAGGIILGPDKKIILVNKIDNPTWWTPPKGKVEKGEDTLEGAKREIYEETGLKNLEYIKELGYFYTPARSKTKLVFKKMTLFLFKTNETNLAPQDPHNPIAAWFTVDEAMQKLQSEEFKNFITKTKHDFI
ncbi:MAG: NUDIX domain-containing protein, partial [Candidatus Magasanikbacteria bacterium]|nr:NUDIX domain-containing protein [Candidatus Magasanikbacteria bacterium]